MFGNSISHFVDRASIPIKTFVRPTILIVTFTNCIFAGFCIPLRSKGILIERILISEVHIILVWRWGKKAKPLHLLLDQLLILIDIRFSQNNCSPLLGPC